MDKIYEYNFSDYTKVLLLESQKYGKYNDIQKYLSGYGGVNNIIIVGIIGSSRKEAIAQYDVKGLKVDAITVASDSNRIDEKTDQIIAMIRS